MRKIWLLVFRVQNVSMLTQTDRPSLEAFEILICSGMERIGLMDHITCGIDEKSG